MLTEREKSALTWIMLGRADFGRAAWMPAMMWASHVGGRAADDLYSAGMVEIWEADDEGTLFEVPMVTLSSFGAWNLSAEVIDEAWVPGGSVWPGQECPRERRRRLRARRAPHFESLEFPDQVADDRPGPAEEVEYMIDSVSESPVVLFAGDTHAAPLPASGCRELKGGVGSPNPFGTRGIPIEIDKRLGKSRQAG